DTLSAVYLSALKDRIYCNAVDDRTRRRAQTVLFDIADALTRIVSPILVHTSDEAWLALHGGSEADSVHLRELPTFEAADRDGRWPAVMELRGEILRCLEESKATLGFKNPLDAGVRARVPAEQFAEVEPFAGEFADLTGVSRFELNEGETLDIQIDDLREEPKCERSWKRDGTVRERSDGGMLTDRDAAVLGI
ncbi:MAG: class I tRNA ligase family protein, partial [Myxococcota bacterium]